MKTNTSLRQFITDGLIGVAVILLIYGILIYLSLPFIKGSASFRFFDIIEFFGVIADPLFRITLLLLILMAFISVGIGGRFLGTMPSRKDWAAPIFKISVISGLVGLVLGAIIIVSSGEMAGFYLFLIVGVLPCLFGVIIGLLIGTLAGVIFNPAKRSYRIIIGAISSAIVGIGLALGFVAAVTMQ